MQPVIMFDFDGVVADSEAVFFREFTAVCTEMGFDRLNSREAFLRLFDGNMIEQMVRAGFPVWRLKRLVKTFQPRIAEANRQVRPFAGMPELLGELAGLHPLYVITSNVSQTVENFLTEYQVRGVLDIIGAEKETSKVKKIRKVRKQHPECAPYYIGDTKGDMVEGRTAGAATVAVAWGWHPEARLREADPDHVVHTPEELRRLFTL
jgi:phosphoglycolate phosphatase